MPRPDEPAPPDHGDQLDADPDAPLQAGEPGLVAGDAALADLDLGGLPVTGITRRRIALLAAAFMTAWIVIVFARQVGEATAATSRAEQMRSANVRLGGEVTALERELELIQRQEYFVQQARGFRLGSPEEIPFTLAPDAPALASDAPGSSAARLGSGGVEVTPLESWLSLLFGPER
jgi:hypothetical protein